MPIHKMHKVDGKVIHTTWIAPPLGTRQFDWSAVLDDYDGAEDAGYQPIGYGPSEEAAIVDLLHEIEAKED